VLTNFLTALAEVYDTRGEELSEAAAGEEASKLSPAPREGPTFRDLLTARVMRCESLLAGAVAGTPASLMAVK
jgi:hypothetical protein